PVLSVAGPLAPPAHEGLLLPFGQLLVRRGRRHGAAFIRAQDARDEQALVRRAAHDARLSAPRAQSTGAAPARAQDARDEQALVGRAATDDRLPALRGQEGVLLPVEPQAS